jgi:hypothetical protein
MEEQQPDPTAVEKSLEAAESKLAPQASNGAANSNGKNGGGGRGKRGGGGGKKQQQQQQAGPAQVGGDSAVSVPGLETTVPAGEMDGLVQAVMNGGAENEAAVMMGEQPTQS